MAKPVTIDFLGNPTGLKRAVRESEAALAGLQSQVARTNAAMATLSKSDSWPALNKAIRDATQSMAGYESQITRAAAASDRLAAANQRWVHGAVVGAKVGAVGVLGFATALAGAAVAAASFDASMRNVNSIAGLSQKGFKNLEQQVLHLSTAVGKSPRDLADGLYSIVSSGFKANDAMKILTAGAKAARAGLTTTATSTQVLTAVLNSYGLGASQAKDVSDKLFQTVNFGVLNFEQLAGSMGKVLPTGKALGVTLSELLAAEAALTRQGNSADESTTQLSAIFTALTKPSKDLTVELKKMGFESGQAAIAHLGLKGTLDQLGKAAGGNQALLASWFHNIRALHGVNGLEGTAHAADTFTAAVKSLNDATKGAGETQKVYQEQQKSTAAQFDHLKAAIDVAAVTIGSALLPQINQGITALTKWFAAAQKSGELQHWAQTIAQDVKATVQWLESLGPAGEKGLHILTATIHSAIPFAEGLLHVIQAIEPELAALAHGATAVSGALGPGPILAGVAGYLALNRAVLTTQVGVGKFAQVMKAGQEATAIAGGGAVFAGGKIDAVGRAAIGAESNFKIAARGIASSFGPQLLAVGAAGIILSIVALENSMTTLKQEANDAANALLHLNDVRLGRQSAALEVRASQIAVDKARSTAGSAAVGVAAARTTAAAVPGGHPNIADPNVTAALSHQRDAILGLQQAENRLAEAQGRLGQANTALNKGSEDLAKQFGGLSSKAQEATTKVVALAQHSTAAIPASAATQANAWADAFVKAARNADGATTASIRTASGVAGLVRQMGRIPDKRTTQLVVDDLKAGRSVATIRADLIKLGLLTPTPKVDVDTTAVAAGVARAKSTLASLIGTPFTVKINEAPGRSGHFDAKGQWVYGAASGMRISGAYGPDNTHIRVTGQEVVLNPLQQRMVDSGHWSIGGALDATGAPTIRAGSGHAQGGKPNRPTLPQFAAFPVNVYDQRESNAKSKLDHERTELASMRKDREHLQKELSTARQKVADAKTAKTRVTAQKALDALERKDGLLIDKILPREALAASKIAQDTTSYQAATRAAKAANQFAGQIKADQDAVTQATQDMQLASDRWSGAKTPADKAKQLKAWEAARGRRVKANSALQGILGRAKSVIGDPNSQYFRDTLASITASQIDDQQAVNELPPADAAGPLAYLTPEQQYQLDRALLTDAAGNPVDPGTAKYLLGVEIANQEAQQQAAAAAGDFALASQITQDEANVQSQLASLNQPNTPAGPSADLQAQNAQLSQQVLNLTRGKGYQAAFDNAAGQGGLGTLTVLGDTRSLAALATGAAKGFNAQPFIAANAGSVTI